jgi:hypothetical protein
MKLDAKWRKSILESTDVYLALIVGIYFQKAISTGVYLIVEIEIPVVLIIITVAVILKKYRNSLYATFRKYVLRAARWVFGVWAALLFTSGNSLIVFYPPIGLPIAALFFVVVVETFHFVNIAQEDKTSSRPLNPDFL